jgi:hypothetical protein
LQGVHYLTAVRYVRATQRVVSTSTAFLNIVKHVVGKPEFHTENSHHLFTPPGTGVNTKRPVTSYFFQEEVVGGVNRCVVRVDGKSYPNKDIIMYRERSYKLNVKKAVSTLADFELCLVTAKTGLYSVKDAARGCATATGTSTANKELTYTVPHGAPSVSSARHSYCLLFVFLFCSTCDLVLFLLCSTCDLVLFLLCSCSAFIMCEQGADVHRAARRTIGWECMIICVKFFLCSRFLLVFFSFSSCCVPVLLHSTRHA